MLPRIKPSSRPKVQTSPPPTTIFPPRQESAPQSRPPPGQNSAAARSSLRRCRATRPPVNHQRRQCLGLLAPPLRRPRAPDRPESRGSPLTTRTALPQKKGPNRLDFPIRHLRPTQPGNHPGTAGKPISPTPVPTPGQIPANAGIQVSGRPGKPAAKTPGRRRNAARHQPPGLSPEKLRHAC